MKTATEWKKSWDNCHHTPWFGEKAYHDWQVNFFAKIQQDAIANQPAPAETSEKP